MITQQELQDPAFCETFVDLFGRENWDIVVADAPRRQREAEATHSLISIADASISSPGCHIEQVRGYDETGWFTLCSCGWERSRLVSEVAAFRLFGAHQRETA